MTTEYELLAAYCWGMSPISKEELGWLEWRSARHSYAAQVRFLRRRGYVVQLRKETQLAPKTHSYLLSVVAPVGTTYEIRLVLCGNRKMRLWLADHLYKFEQVYTSRRFS